MFALAILLLILWGFLLIVSYTLGGLIHILLAVALIVIVVRLLKGRRPLI